MAAMAGRMKRDKEWKIDQAKETSCYWFRVLYRSDKFEADKGCTQESGAYILRDKFIYPTYINFFSALTTVWTCFMVSKKILELSNEMKLITKTVLNS